MSEACDVNLGKCMKMDCVQRKSLPEDRDQALSYLLVLY